MRRTLVGIGAMLAMVLASAGDCNGGTTTDKSCNSVAVPNCPGTLVPKCNTTSGRWECVKS